MKTAGVAAKRPKRIRFKGGQIIPRHLSARPRGLSQGRTRRHAVKAMPAGEVWGERRSAQRVPRR